MSDESQETSRKSTKLVLSKRKVPVKGSQSVPKQKKKVVISSDDEIISDSESSSSSEENPFASEAETEADSEEEEEEEEKSESDTEADTEAENSTASEASSEEEEEPDKFIFSSKVEDTPPGKGDGEHVENAKMYKQLSKIENWRQGLSNMQVCEFTYEDKKYRTIEHAYQAAKIALVDEKEAFKYSLDSGDIIGSGSGSSAVKNSKAVKLNPKQEKKWDGMSSTVLVDIAKAKFSTCELPRQVLLLTKYAELWNSNGTRASFLEEVRDFLRRPAKKIIKTSSGEESEPESASESKIEEKVTSNVEPGSNPVSWEKLIKQDSNERDDVYTMRKIITGIVDNTELTTPDGEELYSAGEASITLGRQITNKFWFGVTYEPKLEALITKYLESSEELNELAEKTEGINTPHKDVMSVRVIRGTPKKKMVKPTDKPATPKSNVPVKAEVVTEVSTETDTKSNESEDDSESETEVPEKLKKSSVKKSSKTSAEASAETSAESPSEAVSIENQPPTEQEEEQEQARELEDTTIAEVQEMERQYDEDVLGRQGEGREEDVEAADVAF